MNSASISSKLLAVAVCAAALAACDSIKDVRSEPATALPLPTAVLRGTIEGLGSRRPVVLEDAGVMRCEDPDDPIDPNDYFGPAYCSASFLGTFNEAVSQFTFGSISEGTAYDVRVRTQPYGKICSVANGAGTMTASGPAAPITVSCVNDPAVPRYTVTANISPAASAIDGLVVSLTTEEGVQQVAATGLTTVTFTDGIFDSGTSVPIMTWRVGATTPEGGRLNKCVVTGGTANNGGNDQGDNTQRPTANVTVNVGACVFTIGGTVAYSLPAGVTTVPAMGAGGVKLQLRNIRGEPVAPEVTVSSFTAPGNAFTLTSTARSNSVEGMHDVVVTGHPAGQFCVVSNGGGANLYVASNANPANITNLVVSCRNRPASDRQLGGTFRLWTYTTTVVANQGDPPVPTTTVTVGDPIISSTAGQVGLQFRNSAMMTFFDNGSFLYGSHNGNSAANTQVEHGFYDYNPIAQTLRFTIHTDTSTGTALTAGLTGTPGPVTVGAGASAVNHRSMGNVQVIPGTPRRITGTFGPYGSAAPPALGTQQVDWELREPTSIDGQMTGTWVTADYRRVWVYEAATTYGFHVGVNGGAANLQDACYTLDDATATTGFYTRRGSLTGCYPLAATVAGGGTVDIPLGAQLALLPGFVGRIPGGETAFDGRSPSPVYFHTAPAASFFSSAAAEFFPAESTDWCATDLLGLRASLHGAPINSPVYFCRTRAN